MIQVPYCLPADITPAQFLAEYWQQKPLLIKNGLPALANMFEPADILDLALDDNATSRLITQQPANNGNGDQWTLKTSDITAQDLQNVPDLWTVLVQNMEQWSPELANLWHAFDFIPQWQRDDIMVSYAPKGGSVGKHYDNYDVFLAQGYGSRHWQLGKFCDENTEFVKGQPIRLLDDMGELVLDEILTPGDVLYVPSNLSHYGVALDDCLTFSFGCRRPNPLLLLDNLADIATHTESLAIPLKIAQPLTSAGEVSQASIDDIKRQLIDLLQSPAGDALIHQTVMETVSKRQYDLLLPEEFMDIDDIGEALANDAVLRQDLASRMVYTDNQLYINGEQVNCDDISANAQRCLTQLADGASINQADLEAAGVTLDDVAEWVENGWVYVDCLD